ncbi:MAG: PD-(D/E)XK nuclease family protein [Phycisphaerales bacterium]
MALTSDPAASRYIALVSTGVETIRLDWDRPLVGQAARALVDRARMLAPGLADLSDLLCVVPGGRSGRLLLAELVRASQPVEDGDAGRSISRQVGAIVPPRVVTPGAFIGELVDGAAASVEGEDRPLAGQLPRVLAWAAALETLPETEQSLLGLRPRDRLANGSGDGAGGAASLLDRIERAASLCALADDLAGEDVACSTAATTAAQLAGDDEAGRFRAIERLAGAASAMLAGVGLAEPTAVQSARAEMAGPRDGGIRRLALVGAIELNRIQRRAVEAFARRGGDVLVLAHADDRWAARLDELGCIRPGPWIDEPLRVDDDELVVAERTSDAAQSVIDAIASVADVRSADEIVIGLVDPALGPLVEQAARWAGLVVRPAAGRSLATFETWRIIEAIARGATSDDEISRLARFPEVERWLHARLGSALPHGDLLMAIDDARRASRPGGSRRSGAALAAARNELATLLAPLVGPPRSLAAWAAPLRAVIAELLGGRRAEPSIGSSGAVGSSDRLDRALGGEHVGAVNHPESATDHGDAVDGVRDDAAELDATVVESIRVVAEELASWSSLPPALAPIVDGPTALALLARRTAADSVPLPPRRGEIEALGWLELHFDDAPVLLLAGAHEGRLPRAAPREPLLPESLRRAIGLPDGQALACRDAYLFDAMRRGRALVRVIAARRDAESAPILASRLVVNAAPALRARRLRRLARAAEAQRIDEPAGIAAPAAQSRFVVPAAPAGPVAIESVAVTAFRAFLECPYRFWLRHVLRLEAVEPPGPQLGPDEFGTLAHEVLKRFGEDESVRDSASARTIEAFLDSALAAEIRRHFGGAPPVAVRVQAARLRERLAAFAALQAARRREGWRIDRVEWSLPADAILDVPDQAPVRVTGRIDRVDRHEDGRVELLDYKTADMARSPRFVHRGTKRKGVAAPWCDLQLPLYLHLWSIVEGGAAPQSGYLVLPRDPSGVAVEGFDLDPHELDDAIDNARGIVQLMRKGGYRPSSDFGDRDDFATICHARALGRLIGREEGASAVDAADGSGVGGGGDP